MLMIFSLEGQNRTRVGRTSSARSKIGFVGVIGIPGTLFSVEFVFDRPTRGSIFHRVLMFQRSLRFPLTAVGGRSRTSWEKTKLRALLGGVSWHAQQVAPHLSAEVGILLSEVNTSTVATLHRANQLLQQARHRKDHEMLIHAFPANTPMVMIAWVDAASQNRHDGSSTQGIVIGAAPATLMQGEVTEVSLMSWHSNKIDRVCRSPGAAETQAAVNGEDILYYLRYQWSEVMHGIGDPKEPDALVSLTPGCVVTDSRNVYDKLQTAVLSIKGAERKSNIELLSLKSAQERTQVSVRWVHSEAQLANPLTKCNSGKELEMFYRMKCRWRLVADDAMQSARKRRAKGLSPLQQGGEPLPQQQTESTFNLESHV